ncbi:MAG: biotin synthase BioB [Desulfarculaceae bacterium]|nr:biotin synthase BioB [Desulfarculaceae bacterium]MCF8072776.1 biotin synthase BioB [Desulfarculaceae bacterium]MCF8100944.1 biotin synthase BioB [Desulfarculaceae bacterium]MCF8117572.1 biotin synthase BioB [Desulfarculaceae bacterium]
MSDNFTKQVHQAARDALQGRRPDPAQAARWIEPQDLGELSQLMAAAGSLRAAHEGETVEFCAIVNARSGRCSEDCAFCAQSAHYPGKAEVYPLLAAEEMVRRGKAAAQAGAQRFGIVTSGRGCPEGEALDEICRAIEVLTGEGIIAPCGSLGLLSPEQARRLRSAGLVRYHHNLEAGPSHFARICTTHAYADRVDTVRAAQDAGLEVCVGGIVGLGESPAERVELAEAVAELEPQSVPLNFLNPIPGTPLSHLDTLSPTQALAAVAVFKLFNPQATVRTCGGRQQVLGNLAPLMYMAGAGATMVGNYLTTEGRQPSEDLDDLAALGLRPAGKLVKEAS